MRDMDTILRGATQRGEAMSETEREHLLREILTHALELAGEVEGRRAPALRAQIRVALTLAGDRPDPVSRVEVRE